MQANSLYKSRETKKFKFGSFTSGWRRWLKNVFAQALYYLVPISYHWVSKDDILSVTADLNIKMTETPASRKTFCCSVARGQLRPAYFSICYVDGQASGQEVDGDGGLHLHHFDDVRPSMGVPSFPRSFPLHTAYNC